MLKARKVDNNETGVFRKPTYTKCVTATRYLENIPEVQVCSLVVNK